METSIEVESSVRGGIARITLNRSEKANALRLSDKQALANALMAASRAPDVRAIVLTGGGERAFCAGSDIGEMQAFDAARMYEMLGAERAMYQAIMESAKPVVAAVNGFALGAGMILAMCCDYVVAAESARFGTPELTIGVACPLEGLLLPWLVGLGRARGFFYTGRQVEAAEALQMGLVQELAPNTRCLEQATESADRLSRLPGRAFQIQKRLLNTLLASGDLEVVINASRSATAEQFADASTGSAMRAFLANRK